MTTYSAVRTTGIYCCPGCGAKPLAENVQTFELAAAAEAAGYRACLRCRPYRVAGTVADEAPELVCRAVQLIITGFLDDVDETALAARLGLSARHLRRMFNDHLGVTPDQFARSRRAHFARRLLDDSDLTIADIAFASGFGSLRQFNRAMLDIFRSTPRELRDRRRRTDRLAADGGLVLRMPYTPPYDWPAMLAFLAAHAVPGVESVADGVYRRTITLDGDPGLLEITAGGADHLLLRAHLPYWEGVIHVVERAVQAVVRDQAPAKADEILAQLVEAAGTPVAGLGHGLTHAFPSAEALLTQYSGPVGKTLAVLAKEVASGNLKLDDAEPLEILVAVLTSIDGVSEQAAHHIALRLGARDAFPGEPATSSEAWRPWRALAYLHLTQ